MRLIVDIAAVVLFVIATGLLFSEGVRASRALFIVIGIVALASSYVITKTVLDSTVGHRMHRHAAAATQSAGGPAPAVAPPASVSSAATDAVLEQVYTFTESTLNRIVRAGTKQSTASVSSDTVVDVIVGISLALLGLLSQIFVGVFRRLVGAD